MGLNFNAESATFRTLMGNSVRYRVPVFQRDYAWDVEQWEDFWQDAIESAQDGEEHYMGYLVLQGQDRQHYKIIDGQQRLTTITILILSVLYELERLIQGGCDPEGNQKRLEALRNSYIGFIDPVSLVTQPKLTLNRHNDAYFRTYLCALQPLPVRGLKASEHLLRKAKEFFSKKISEKKKCSEGSSLASFIEQLVDRLLFTVITVDDELNAYKVFETLNARGVKLSTPDLVKNYLFSVMAEGVDDVHEDAVRQWEDRWEHISAQLGEYSFADFVNSEWNSCNPFVKKTQLFKKIKERIKTKQDSLDYLRRLDCASEIYAALRNHRDEFWAKKEGYKDAVSYLKTLELFNITQPQGLLMAAYLRFEPRDFIRLLQLLEVVSVRYNVIGQKPPNVQEVLYNRLAFEVSSDRVNFSDLCQNFKEVYPADEEFLDDFARKTMKTIQSPRKARFLLGRIERCLAPEVTLDDESLTLEHVLPCSPDAAWIADFGNDWEECVERLGNMTLLSQRQNQKLSNATFAEKKTLYTGSGLRLTQQCADYERWTRGAIEHRQRWLADAAVRCWRIEALR